MLPFLAAASLNGVNLLLAIVLLPEPARERVRAPVRWSQLNAFAALIWLGSVRALAPLIAIYCALCLLGQVPAALWVLYGQNRYDWTPSLVGWSFACFGLLFSLSQVLLAGRLTARLGNRRTLRVGMVCDAVGSLLMGLSRRGWMPFAIMPLLAAGSIGQPALQAELSGAVGEARQGELQGTLSSLASLASVVGPLLATAGYAATQDSLPGAAWFVAAAGYLVCLLL